MKHITFLFLGLFCALTAFGQYDFYERYAHRPLVVALYDPGEQEEDSLMAMERVQLVCMPFIDSVWLPLREEFAIPDMRWDAQMWFVDCRDRQDPTQPAPRVEGKIDLMRSCLLIANEISSPNITFYFPRSREQWERLMLRMALSDLTMPHVQIDLTKRPTLLDEIQPAVPGMSPIFDRVYKDNHKVSLRDWREYYFFLQAFHADDPAEVRRLAYPDSALFRTVYDQDFLDALTSVTPQLYERPIVGVSIEQARAYCEWRAEMWRTRKYVKINSPFRIILPSATLQLAANEQPVTDQEWQRYAQAVAYLYGRDSETFRRLTAYDGAIPSPEQLDAYVDWHSQQHRRRYQILRANREALRDDNGSGIPELIEGVPTKPGVAYGFRCLAVFE